MPSFSDSIFLFVLALLLFGPKKLPVLARELGKWMGEFRRASNEFKFQMEDELRMSEQADRQKQIAAMEAAAPISPPIADTASAEPGAVPASAEADSTTDPLPIAVSGELKIMPPSTGLPVAQARPGSSLSNLIHAIPEAEPTPSEPLLNHASEAAAHGD